VWKGKSFTVKKGAPNFLQLREAVVSEKWDEIEGHLTVKKSLESWAGGDFQVRNGKFYYGDEELPEELNQRISEMAAQNEDPISVLNFYKRLKKNPSYRSVNQLWRFMKHRGIPLTKAGTFLAYKGVRADYKDQHSGTFLNTPGAELEMDRNKVSDDPNTACHEGFHVGALEYARSFAPGGRVVVCEVDPENVVCVPYDSSDQKMRVCRYKVLGNHNDELLPSTSFVDERDSIEDGIEEQDEENFNIPSSNETQPEDGAPSPRKPKKGWKKFENMDMKQLMEQSIEDLRKYAAKGLDIIGASKIPGGKTTLVQRILKVRE
jgi:hypothetical protein